MSEIRNQITIYVLCSDCSKRWAYVRDYYIRRKGKPGTDSGGEAAKNRSVLLSFLDSLPSSQRLNTITNVLEMRLGLTRVNLWKTLTLTSKKTSPRLMEEKKI